MPRSPTHPGKSQVLSALRPHPGRLPRALPASSRDEASKWAGGSGGRGAGSPAPPVQSRVTKSRDGVSRPAGPHLASPPQEVTCEAQDDVGVQAERPHLQQAGDLAGRAAGRLGRPRERHGGAERGEPLPAPPAAAAPPSLAARPPPPRPAPRRAARRAARQPPAPRPCARRAPPRAATRRSARGPPARRTPTPLPRALPAGAAAEGGGDAAERGSRHLRRQRQALPLSSTVAAGRSEAPSPGDAGDLQALGRGRPPAPPGAASYSDPGQPPAPCRQGSLPQDTPSSPGLALALGSWGQGDRHTVRTLSAPTQLHCLLPASRTPPWGSWWRGLKTSHLCPPPWPLFSRTSGEGLPRVGHSRIDEGRGGCLHHLIYQCRAERPLGTRRQA